MRRLIVAAMALQISCACWNDPAKMHEEKCVVARQIVDCATADISALLPVGKPVLDFFLSGMAGAFDWGAVLRALGWVGFDKAICILEQLQRDYTGPQSAKLKTMPDLNLYLRDKYPTLVVKVK